jgi:acetylglutamate synthase
MMAVDTSQRNRLIVMKYLDAATTLLKARLQLKGLREAIEAHGADQVLTMDVFDGVNAQVQASDFPPFLAAMDALEALLVDPATGLPTDHLKAIMKFQRADAI